MSHRHLTQDQLVPGAIYFFEPGLGSITFIHSVRDELFTSHGQFAAHNLLPCLPYTHDLGLPGGSIAYRGTAEGCRLHARKMNLPGIVLNPTPPVQTQLLPLDLVPGAEYEVHTKHGVHYWTRFSHVAEGSRLVFSEGRSFHPATLARVFICTHKLVHQCGGRTIYIGSEEGCHREQERGPNRYTQMDILSLQPVQKPDPLQTLTSAVRETLAELSTLPDLKRIHARLTEALSHV
jgi:hypothetical protein